VSCCYILQCAHARGTAINITAEWWYTLFEMGFSEREYCGSIGAYQKGLKIWNVYFGEYYFSPPEIRVSIQDHPAEVFIVIPLLAWTLLGCIQWVIILGMIATSFAYDIPEWFLSSYFFPTSILRYNIYNIRKSIKNIPLCTNDIFFFF